MPVRSSSDDWLTLEEAATIIGLSRFTVGRFVRAGTIAATRAGGRIRVQRSALDAYIEQQRIAPGYLPHLQRR